MRKKRFFKLNINPDDNRKKRRLFKRYILLWIFLIIIWFLFCPLLKYLVSHTIIDSSTASTFMIYFTTVCALFVVTVPFFLVSLYITSYLEHIFDWIAGKRN